MDFYHYDPSLYYASEDDASSSAGPKIRFEFGASTSLSTSSSTAQAQAVGSEDPPSEAQTKFFMGMAFTIVIVMVRSYAVRRYACVIGHKRFLTHPLFTLDVRGCGGLESTPNGQHPGRGSRRQRGGRGRSRRQRGRCRWYNAGYRPEEAVVINVPVRQPRRSARATCCPVRFPEGVA
jgi:hypothetical protein